MSQGRASTASSDESACDEIIQTARFSERRFNSNHARLELLHNAQLPFEADDEEPLKSTARDAFRYEFVPKFKRWWQNYFNTKAMWRFATPAGCAVSFRE